MSEDRLLTDEEIMPFLTTTDRYGSVVVKQKEAFEAQDVKSVKLERKAIARVLKENRMGTQPEHEENVPNPLWRVLIYDDELECLLKGEWPEDWDNIEFIRGERP